MTKSEIENQIAKLDQIILEKKSYLYSTDYKVLKVAEGVEEEDLEIKKLRAMARDTINLCENKIAELKLIEPEEEVIIDHIDMMDADAQ